VRMRNLRGVVAVTAVGALTGSIVEEVTFYDCSFSTVLIVDVPAPAMADEIERALCLTYGKVRLNLEGGGGSSGETALIGP
jgi:hypothetical protein